MTRANQPWTIFPAFKTIIAVAFATGAYGLIFPTLWQLSDAYGLVRFVALMGLAVAAMVVWLIIAHDLWEKPRAGDSRAPVRLYNAATVTTLSTAVILYYVVLFILFLIAVVVFVPTSLFQSKLGHGLAPVGYIQLAWLTASVATAAGALGSGLESDETVLNATYGYRQRARAAQKESE